MSTQFIQCVGVWCIWSIGNNRLTLRNHPLGDSGNTNTTDSSPKTNLPFYQPNRIKQNNMDTPHQHPYGIRSKTRTNTIFQAPNIGEDSKVETKFGSLVSSLFGLLLYHS